MNPFFRAHNVIPKQAKLQQLATLLQKPQMAQQVSPQSLTPEEITLSAHKKRPLAGPGILGQNNSLPKGGADVL